MDISCWKKKKSASPRRKGGILDNIFFHQNCYCMNIFAAVWGYVKFIYEYVYLYVLYVIYVKLSSCVYVYVCGYLKFTYMYMYMYMY